MIHIKISSCNPDCIDDALRHAVTWPDTVKVFRRSPGEAEVVINTGYEREADRSFLEKARRLMMSIFTPLEVVVRDVLPTKNKKNDRVSYPTGLMKEFILSHG